MTTMSAEYTGKDMCASQEFKKRVAAIRMHHINRYVLTQSDRADLRSPLKEVYTCFYGPSA